MDLSHNQFSGLLPRKYFENLMGMIHVRANGLKYMDHGYYQDTVMVVIKGSDFQLEKILVMFTTIDFSNNIFVRDIPTVIGKLKSLKGLNFSHNQLTSYIPRSFGNLTNLEWLDISTNRLVGEIPRDLADLAMLAKLHLSENRLVAMASNLIHLRTIHTMEIWDCVDFHFPELASMMWYIHCHQHPFSKKMIWRM
ncbi:PREDICTED: receptor [Prunus dulcis]|uniref:PREDICTED: receptor n=1 Tax=Prunus dulcis TaxID=3755 RepID=A0A5E4G6J2_PRUDU|nr:PREDICTED: receptor [Prunus dulcis]